MTGNGRADLREELTNWPGVSIHPHRFGGVEFQLNGKEIGHIHDNRLVDVRLLKSERDRWILEGKAWPHHMYPDSGWVSVHLNNEQDVANAIEILRSRYDQMVSRRM